MSVGNERSERDSIRGGGQCKIGYMFDVYYWRASVASETLTGVTQSKIEDVCLFIYLYICMDVRKAFLYFDPRVFVLVRLSVPSQIALNRILWFSDQYPYHPRN